MSTQTKKIIRNLGNGLILRHASPEDGEALGSFFGEQLGDGGLTSRDGQGLVAMTRDLFSRSHVSLSPNDFTIVEETSSGRIVSAMCLIQQTWMYEGIEFGFGRPEYVATHPDFRKRGLVRTQFDTVHQWSAENGLMVQGITGIPYFYRQFGYEFALNLGGRRCGSVLPKPKEGESEKFVLRPAEEKDIPFLMSVYEQGCRRSMVSAKWTYEHWHNNLYEMSADNIQRLEFRVIERAETHEPVGYLAHPGSLTISGAYAFHYEVKSGVSWLEVSPFVSRYLWNVGQEYAKAENKVCESFGFYLGESHPAYQALGNISRCKTRLQGTYEWLSGKPAAAQEWWKKSLAEAERMGLRYDIGEIHLEIGTRLNECEHLEKAESVFAGIGDGLELAKTRDLLGR